MSTVEKQHKGFVFALHARKDERKEELCPYERVERLIYLLEMFLSSVEHKLVHVMVLQLLTKGRENAS